ncbi:MFS transporter [Streptomyces ipomoeae]|uniref:MFS transporter n=1 Tax=Streptomyces ipomoeae TaxID=103232 RepID=UPI001146F9EA|nr:MFS transporter [Streptomyces ipomoeae]MDX2937928.1 MFS transporter [Streptomyces ipomoeae]TQE18305.1 MFS transporter [Streptomyces ipomoeae]
MTATDNGATADTTTPGGTARERRSFELRILSLVTLSIFLVVASTSVLAIALPTVARHFGASAFESTWLLLMPSLVQTCFLILFGRVADLVGLRWMFLSGLGVFTAAAVLSGFAASVVMLIALGAVQAVGAAMVMCNTGAIVGAVFPGRRLGRAMGVYLAGVSVAQMIAPSVGGLVTGTVGWRWLYWGQVPFALGCVVLGARYLAALPRTPDRTRSLDVRGALTLSLMSGFLVYGVSSVQSSGLRSWEVVVGLAVSVALVPVLIVVESRAEDPILQARLLRRGSFLLANLSNLLSVLPRFETVLIAGLYYQTVLGDSAVTAGLKVLPLPVGITVGSLVADRVAARRGMRVTAIQASVTMAAGLGLLALSFSGGRPYGWHLLALLAIGLGAGVFSTVNSTLIIREAPPGEIGTVNGIRLTVMNVGGSVALAAGLTIATSSLPADARSAFYEATVEPGTGTGALMHGFELLFVVMIVAALASGLILLAKPASGWASADDPPPRKAAPDQG